MWQRFTERARRVVFSAQEEAGRLGWNEVGTEHLLLGILMDEDSLAIRLLCRVGIAPRDVKAELDRKIVLGNGQIGQDMKLTNGSKRVIDLAYDNARELSNNYIGTEHILLGLIDENQGAASQTLQKLGAEHTRIMTEILAMQDTRESSGSTGAQSGGKAMDERYMESAQKALIESKDLRGRDLLSIDDLSLKDIRLIFDTTRFLKEELPRIKQLDILKGKTLAMIFEKPSLRTRVTFETGMTQLGGHAIYLGPSDAQIGKRESVADSAQNLARWVDGIMARVFSHDTVAGLAEYGNIPVINGLSDVEHPCQALADLYTVIEKKGKLEGLKFAFIGDGNNVCNSLMLLCAKLGVNFVVGCPKGYEPPMDIVERSKAIAAETGAKVEVVNDPATAAKDSDALYTDVWASMGQESEAAERKKIFAEFQVNQALVEKAKDDAIVLHCLPAHRGEEITDEVMDGPHSVVIDEAENRLHVQKAVLVLTL